MIPKRLVLQNFKGIQAGLGMGEVDIDLSSLPPGLIAITGPNGAGKTTVMDSLTPYRLQPFKVKGSTSWGVGEFSFYDQVAGEGKKELWWNMNGRSYKSLILIDAIRRKQECYLHELVGGAWVPVAGVDGKTKNYDSAVERIVGSPQLFFSSVYRCQGARSLSDYRRSEIVSILSELLNLDHIRQQGDKCRQVVSSLQGKLDILRAKLADIDADAAVVTDLQHAISEHDSLIAEEHMRLDFTKKELDDTRVVIAGIKERAAAADSDIARRQQLSAQIASEHQRLSDEQRRLAQVEADFDRRIESLKASHAAFVSQQGQRIARAEKIVSGAEQIRLAVDSEADLVAQVELHNAEITRLRAERDALRDAAVEYDKKLAGVHVAIRNAELSVSRLDGLDCRADGSGWLNPDCRLIADAVSHRDSLEGLRQVAADLDRRVAEDRVAIEAYSNSLGVAIDLYDEAAAKRDECRKFSRLLPELEMAERDLSDWRQELVDRAKQFESDVKTLEGEKWYAGSEYDLMLSKSGSVIRDLEAQRDSIPVPADEKDQLRSAQIREGALLSAIDGYEQNILDAERHVSGLKAKLLSCRDRQVSGESMRTEEAVIAKRISTFSILQKACSNDGVIALELDDAAPAIASIVNQLLRECYGSRFSVRMETQAEKLDGSMKETFDIIVLDSENGDERSITECSGGQVLWIEDAITRGICLFNIHRSDRVFGALFSDERDGALDADRRREFMAVKRKSLEIGTHQQEFFISQSPELVDMASARIVLEKGRVCVV